jgi:anaerobic ribonucleoside-triphosphate reductase activating protein
MRGAYIARICTSFIDVPDKVAVAVYFAGCSIRCKGCQNAILWEKSSGTLTSIELVLNKIQDNQLADSIVFLGGEPTDQIEFLIELCKNVSLFKTLYTGREFENLPEDLTKTLDMIVCGPYRQDLQCQGFPASSNQRIFKKENESWICQNYK